VIGHGSGKAGSHGVHGAPLGAADLKQVKTKFGFNPEEVSDAFRFQRNGVFVLFCNSGFLPPFLHTVRN
jgi:hypothetical protein